MYACIMFSWYIFMVDINNISVAISSNIQLFAANFTFYIINKIFFKLQLFE